MGTTAESAGQPFIAMFSMHLFSNYRKGSSPQAVRRASHAPYNRRTPVHGTTVQKENQYLSASEVRNVTMSAQRTTKRYQKIKGDRRRLAHAQVLYLFMLSEMYSVHATTTIASMHRV
jgi:hypothetical protein